MDGKEPRWSILKMMGSDLYDGRNLPELASGWAYIGGGSELHYFTGLVSLCGGFATKPPPLKDHIKAHERYCVSCASLNRVIVDAMKGARDL